MKLRFYSEYNEHGLDTVSEELQYWDEEYKRWFPVEFVRTSYKNHQEAMTEEDFRWA